MQTKMKIETRPLSELNPAAYNPRVMLLPDDPEYQRIKASIEKFGYVDPIIINSDGTIVGGHQRFNVLKDLGYSEAQVVVCNLSKDEEKALNIALNKITGEWDDDKLKTLLGEINLSDIDLAVTGFDEKELKNLIGDVKLDEADFSLNEGTEIDLDDFADEQFECKCPRCGFTFNRGDS